MIQIDMEMPEKCGLCPLFHAEHPMYCQGVKADRKKKIVAPYRDPRPEWCPIPEIQPDPDTVSRKAVLDAVCEELDSIDHVPQWVFDRLTKKIENLPSAQPELCEGAVSRRRLLSDLKELIAAWEKYPVMAEQIKGVEAAIGYVESIPSAQEKRTEERTETHTCDCISRQAAIDALDVLCQEHRYKIPGKRETYSQYNEAWQDALDRAEGAIGNLPSVQSEPHWIPVTERLPEPRIDVWVNSDIGQIQGYYEENAETWYASFGQGRDYLELIVNAWMPLPDPYQEEGDSE